MSVGYSSHIMVQEYELLGNWYDKFILIIKINMNLFIGLGYTRAPDGMGKVPYRTYLT